MIFAQTTPPAEIAAWLACAAFVMMMVNSGFKLTRNLRGADPQPPNSNLGQSIQELDRRVSEIEVWRDDFATKLDEDKTEIIAAGQHREERLRAEIAELRHEVNRYSQDTERALGRIEGKLK